jgi:hypothetical protein
VLETAVGGGLPGGPGSFEDFEDDFPGVLRRGQTGRGSENIEDGMKGGSLNEGRFHRGTGGPTGVGPLRGLNSYEDRFLGGRVLKEDDPSMRAGTLEKGWSPDDRWSCYLGRHSLREKAVLDSALSTHEVFSSSKGSLEEMAMEKGRVPIEDTLSPRNAFSSSEELPR